MSEETGWFPSRRMWRESAEEMGAVVAVTLTLFGAYLLAGGDLAWLDEWGGLFGLAPAFAAVIIVRRNRNARPRTPEPK